MRNVYGHQKTKTIDKQVRNLTSQRWRLQTSSVIRHQFQPDHHGHQQNHNHYCHNQIIDSP